MVREPFSGSMTVRQARDAYLAENGFTVQAYDAKTTDASFLGIKFAVPNTPRHRVGIMLHDLHHVVTGFGTDIRGEGEISVWEARRGLKPLGLYVATIVTSGALAGFLFAPRRALHAWQKSVGGASLFPMCQLDARAFEARYAELLEMTVDELRRELSVPSEGIAETPRKLHAYAPA